ncbi:hypothetical protein DZF91_37560 [Actinomadura logoneensis]|uniref:NPCBM-associated, NEW3 domain of alpha-galactosidase n=1 Tax=Actinomadura logoneensis TaxID=2293572 RepID=A0A372J978_9ACTN|nr:hypothetical protein [Actinomadura logoneensis]RFU36543.1 hypothetical protein DZF91_37560 [Actinomadura logoneensis]
MTTTRTRRRLGLAAAALIAGLPALTALPAHADTTPRIASTSVSPATITGGDEAVQTIRLDAPAPVGGLGVEVISVGRSDLNYPFSVPGDVVRVPAGQTSVSFPIRLEAYSSTTTVPLVARTTSSEATTQVTVVPPDWRDQTVERLDVNAPGDAHAVVAGTKATATVRLSAPAKVGGTAVDLRLNHRSGLPDSPEPKIPRYVVVPAGSREATFTIDYPGVPIWPIGVTDIDADLGHPPAGAAVLFAPKNYTVGVTRELKRGGFPNIGSIGLGNNWHPFGAVIELTSDTPGIKVPARVEIPANSAGANFGIGVDESVPPGTQVKISAKWVLSPAGTVTTTATVAG